MNHNEKFEKFISDFEKIKMTQQEKESIAKRIELFADTHSLRPSPYQQYYLPFLKKTLSFALVVTLMISLSKPASAKALPGELLYPVKIIHEEIEAATIKEPEERVNFEIKRTEKRIKEAVTLAKEKELDPKTQKQIAQKIEKQVKEVTEKINEIKEEDPKQALSLNSELKTTLKVNSKALKEVTKKKKKKRKRKEKKEEKIPEQITVEEQEKTSPAHEKITEETKKEEEVQEEHTSQNQEMEEKEGEDKIVPEEATKQQEQTEPSQESAEQNTEENQEQKETGEEASVETEENEPEEIDIILASIQETIENTEIIEDVLEQEIVASEQENLDQANLSNNQEETVVTENNTPEQTTTEEQEINEEKVGGIAQEQTDNQVTTEETLSNQSPEQPEQEIVGEEVGGIAQEQTDNQITTEETLPDQSPEQPEQEIVEEEVGGIAQEQTETQTAVGENENTLYQTEKDPILSLLNPIKQEVMSTISDDLQEKITSLNQILDAENRLKELLLELNKERSLENINQVKTFIELKQFGKAYIFIQKEIETLQELKLQKMVEDEFGIKILSQENIQKTQQ